MIPEKLFTSMTDKLTEKFQAALDIQVEHARKISKENQLLRSKLTPLLRQTKTDLTSNSSSSEPLPARVRGEPIWVGKLDLMTLRPEGGPSRFGRCIGAAVFGSNEKCLLINQRIGARYLKNGARVACDSDLEQKFRDCIARNFGNDAAEAIAKAIG